MKVLNIIQRYYPARGGAELFIQILSEHLASLGWDIDIWTTNAYEPNTLWDLEGKIIDNEHENINGVNVYRFPIGKGILKYKYPNKIFRELFKYSPEWKLANLATCPTVFSMLEKAKKSKLEYDVVTVSSTPYYFLFYVGYVVAQRLNIPYVLVPALHPGLNEKDKLRKKYLRKSIVPFFRRADLIILNTEAEGEEIKSFCLKYGVDIPEEKFKVIGQGVYIDKVTGGSGERFRKKYSIKGPIVFQIGTKTEDKGSFDLIRSMKILWDEGVKSKLVFGGASNEDHSRFIENLAEKYRKNILSIDDISEEDKLDLYDAGDIFSMVSKTDSFGIVYLEAWANKKPVLACDNSVMKSLITNQEDGFLVKFGDTEGLAKYLKLLLNSSELRKEIGEKGYRKVVGKYDWNSNLSRLSTLYKNILIKK